MVSALRDCLATSMIPPEEAPESKIVDLMDALKASISTSDKRQAARGKPAKRVSKRAGATQTSAGTKAVAKKAGRARKT